MTDRPPPYPTLADFAGDPAGVILTRAKDPRTSRARRVELAGYATAQPERIRLAVIDLERRHRLEVAAYETERREWVDAIPTLRRLAARPDPDPVTTYATRNNPKETTP